MRTKNFKILFLTALLAVILSGCSINFNTGGSNGDSNSDGAVFKSPDKGASWQQKALVLTVDYRRSLAATDVIALALDPGDNKAVYAGTLEDGLSYSYDGGEGWQIAKSLGKVTVAHVAVDAGNKCVIYAAVANKLYKSQDCSRNWSVVYFDAELKTGVTALLLDYSNGNNVYIGTSRGEIIKSSDRGGSWKVLNKFNAQVDKIVINPVNAANIFAGTAAGIFRSTDAGLSWVNLEDKLKAFDGNRLFRDLIIIRADKPTIFLAAGYGLFKSTDGGDSWSRINLITPEAGVTINGIAANPYDAQEIYYVTNTTFYRTVDGGKNWTPKQLPTSRAGWKIAVDPKNPEVIYLGVKRLKK